MAFIERPDLRSRLVKVFEDDTSPNHFRAVWTLHDQHYLDGGQWLDVIEDLADDATDGYAAACTKARHIIRVGSTGTRRWYPRRGHPGEHVSFGRLQSWSGSAWQNVNLGTPTRTGNKITWSTANFDLTITNNWHRIKMAAVLKTENARRRLRWAVTLTGLTYNQGALVSIADGTTVGYVERPVAWDANGSEENPNVTITTTYEGGFIEFGGNLSAAVLPITIDPTFTDGDGGDVTSAFDTYLKSSTATTNYGTSNDIRVDTGSAHCGLISYNLASLTGTCNSATAYLYYSVTPGLSDRTGTIYEIADANLDWTEGGATWDTKDGTNAWAGSNGCATSGTDYDSTAIGTFSAPGSTAGGAVGDELTSSLTTAAVEACFGSTLELRIVTSGERYYASSDHPTPGYRPKLVVDYTTAGGVVIPVFMNQYRQRRS